MYVLMFGLSLEILEHLVMIHLDKLRSICAHYENFVVSYFMVVGCRLLMSMIMIARSFLYVVVLHDVHVVLT